MKKEIMPLIFGNYYKSINHNWFYLYYVMSIVDRHSWNCLQYGLQYPIQKSLVSLQCAGEWIKISGWASSTVFFYWCQISLSLVWNHLFQTLSQHATMKWLQTSTAIYFTCYLLPVKWHLTRRSRGDRHHKYIIEFASYHSGALIVYKSTIFEWVPSTLHLGYLITKIMGLKINRIRSKSKNLFLTLHFFKFLVHTVFYNRYIPMCEKNINTFSWVFLARSSNGLFFMIQVAIFGRCWYWKEKIILHRNVKFLVNHDFALF